MRYYNKVMLAALCDVDCSVLPPEFSVDNCAPDRLKGGIVQTIISSCDLDWDAENLVDGTFWQTQIDADKVKATGREKGGGFNFTTATEETDACRPAELTGGTWTATIKDFNFVLADSSDNDFWNAVVQNPNKFQVGFRTSQDYFFGFFPCTVSGMNYTVPDDCKQLSFREVTFQWNDLNQPARTYLSFLQSKFPI